jgi:hypothetical protein
MINHIINNSSLDIGKKYKTHVVDDLDGHSVWLKDVEYVDTKGEKKKCKSLDEYFRLPPKRLTIAKKPITRQTCRFQPGECAIFG